MAKYSPGYINSLPEDLSFAVPYFLNSKNVIDPDFQPDNTDLSLLANRLGLDLAAGSWSGSQAKSEWSDNEIFQQQSFTFSFWVYYDSFASQTVYVQCKLTSATGISSFMCRNTGSPANRLTFLIRDVNDNNESVISDVLSTLTWYHFICLVDSPDFYLYQDNSLVDSDTLADDIQFDDNSFVLGNRLSGNRTLNGRMSDFYFWPRALTSDERDQVYNFYSVGRGSNRGNVFQKSGNSFSIRSRKKPIFQRTPLSSRARNSFTHVRSNYPSLSSPQKTAFETNAPLFPRIDSLGASYNLRGTSLFSSQNISLARESVSLNDTSQVPHSFPSYSFDFPTFDISAEELIPTVDPLAVPAGYIMRFFVSAPGPVQVPGELRKITRLVASLTAGQDTDVNIWDEWISVFGSPPDFDTTFILVWASLLHVSSGQIDPFAVTAVLSD